MIPQHECCSLSSCEGYPSPDMGRWGQVISLYVEDVPLSPTERSAHEHLAATLPPPMEHGMRVRVWKHWYPDAAYPGLTIGLRDITVSASNEVLIPYDEFKMENVPWEKL
ncbi:hypothetical protein vBPFY1MI_78 [Pseudomonas phage vB_PF_Y1-MI]|nr:hypothetical protein vBPFY1MI_78 [Pseudomonas phage vB_PF_Y1-MI]